MRSDQKMATAQSNEERYFHEGLNSQQATLDGSIVSHQEGDLVVPWL